MSSGTARSTRLPGVDLLKFRELYILQAELRGCDLQLRDFTPLRDRLVASGRDANAVYREIQSRRDQVMAELTKSAPATPARPGIGSGSFGPQRRGSALSLPIAPPRFLPPNLSPWFGFSGTLVMGRASDGISQTAQGVLPTSGSIETFALADDGSVEFGGDLKVGVPWYNPAAQYIWMHSWNYLVPFPAPPVTSILSYRMELGVQAVVTFIGAAPPYLESFVAVGETANFLGQNIEVDTNVGLPFFADLSQPYFAQESQYSGPNSPGIIQGSSIVQRSLLVEAGHVPVVAVTVGVASFQTEGSTVMLQDAGLGVSSVYPGLGGPGLVLFNYSPQIVVHQ